MPKARALLSILAATIVAIVLAPAPAQATSGPATYRLAANSVFGHKYKFTQYNSTAGACYYRVRYGKFGTAAYAQIRFYGGACGGTQVAVITRHPGSGTIEYFWQDGNTSGSDGCGSYFELQATSPANHAPIGMQVNTPHAYRISYFPDAANTDTSFGC
jgi:hypothetical protein